MPGLGLQDQIIWYKLTLLLSGLSHLFQIPDYKLLDLNFLMIYLIQRVMGVKCEILHSILFSRLFIEFEFPAGRDRTAFPDGGYQHLVRA